MQVRILPRALASQRVSDSHVPRHERATPTTVRRPCDLEQQRVIARIIRCMRWLRCLPASLILCAFPPAAPAQTFVAASGGVGFAGPNPSIPGFLAQASVGHQGPSGGWRVDVFAAEGFQASKPEQFPFIVMPQMCSRSGCITRFETTPAAVPIGMAGAALSDIVPLAHLDEWHRDILYRRRRDRLVP